MTPVTLAPRILLLMPDQWSRALLRAALRELGYDATGTRALTGALRQAAPMPGRDPVRLVVLDQDALPVEDGGEVQELLRGLAIPIVLIAPVMRRAREGPWTRVVRRPISIGGLVRTVQDLVPLKPEARQPID
jgi:CheY-like chemotaxis protein